MTERAPRKLKSFLATHLLASKKPHGTAEEKHAQSFRTPLPLSPRASYSALPPPLPGFSSHKNTPTSRYAPVAFLLPRTRFTPVHSAVALCSLASHLALFSHLAHSPLPPPLRLHDLSHTTPHRSGLHCCRRRTDADQSHPQDR